MIASADRPMRVVMFCHSLVSDWNHGNAHFLRGVVHELRQRGVDVAVYEPENGWSRRRLVEGHGTGPIEAFEEVYGGLTSFFYDADTLDLDAALEGADLVIVHEWNDPQLISRLGRHRRRHDSYRLLFHDTHHRAATEPAAMEAIDLSGFDGVLAFGEVIRRIYLERGWCDRAWIWHEAADTRVFRPLDGEPEVGELVWIGNWGDDERSAELHEFLLRPVRDLGLSATVHGVRYPPEAIAALAEAGVGYAGWLANFNVPWAFARHRVTVHVPRRPYASALPGIPTIRPFEALACGIPLVSSPWDDVEGLFTPGEDFLVARDGAEMKEHLRAVLNDEDLARELAQNGRRTILERHTCGHRVDELLEIARELGRPGTATVGRRRSFRERTDVARSVVARSKRTGEAGNS